jgi:hypothetical protein
MEVAGIESLGAEPFVDTLLPRHKNWIYCTGCSLKADLAPIWRAELNDRGERRLMGRGGLTLS